MAKPKSTRKTFPFPYGPLQTNTRSPPPFSVLYPRLEALLEGATSGLIAIPSRMNPTSSGSHLLPVSPVAFAFGLPVPELPGADGTPDDPCLNGPERQAPARMDEQATIANFIKTQLILSTELHHHQSSIPTANYRHVAVEPRQKAAAQRLPGAFRTRRDTRAR